MDSKVRGSIAELVGTFCLVFLAGCVVCANYVHESGEPIYGMWAIGLADGFALAVLLTISSRVSEGCLNPAITLMLWVCKRLDGWQTMSLVAAQLLGSVLAGLALRVIFPENALRLAQMGAPHVGTLLMTDNVITFWTLVKGIALETFATFVLTLVVFSTLLDRRGSRLGGLFAGLTQTVLTLALFRLTGGAANPARWFGPALWHLSVESLKANAFADHPVYWVGPVIGALLGGLLYTTVIGPGTRVPEAGS